MLKIIDGDLFTANADVLAHGCNTFGIMGKGIAVPFRKKWPNMYARYALQCKKSPEELWGTSLLWDNPAGKPHIACLFTQNGWLAIPDYIEYAFIDLKNQMNSRKLSTLAIPAIGCGLAQTNAMTIDVLTSLVDKIFTNIDVSLYRFGD